MIDSETRENLSSAQAWTHSANGVQTASQSERLQSLASGQVGAVPEPGPAANQ